MIILALSLLISPPSVVSLDYCSDQYVLALAGEDQILALSPDATADFNAMAEEASGYRQIRRTAEDVLSLQPELVVRSYAGDPRELALFERAGIRVHTLGYVVSFDDIRGEITAVAEALDQPGKGRVLIDDMDEILSGMLAVPGDKGAVYVTPGGVTAGQGTLVHHIIEAAGLTNDMAEQGLNGWADLSLEDLIVDPPSLIVSGYFTTRANKTDQWSPARHPVLMRLLNEVERYELDAADISCGGWTAADAAQALNQEIREARSGS